MKLPLSPFWLKIVDYYYDNVHYNSEHPITIKQWVKNTYNATVALDRNYIRFEKESDKTLFLLRWS